MRASAWSSAADEVETVLWVTAAAVGATATGGGLSPLSAAFAIPVVLNAERGGTRLAIEAAVFAVIGYGVVLAASAWFETPGAGPQTGLQIGLIGPLLAFGVFVFMAWRMWRGRAEPRRAAPPLPRAEVSHRVQTPVVRTAPPAPAAGDAARDAAAARAEAAEARAKEAETRFERQMLFFSQMTHELRTPLNAVLGYSEMIRAGVFGPIGPKYADYASRIEEGGRMLLMIVDDLLDFARIRAGRYDLDRDEASLNDIAAEAVRLMGETAARRSVRLTVAAVEEVEAWVDSRAVRHMALNLVSNALKFTPEGGRVTIAPMADEDGAWLSVQDTGPGMTQDDVKRVMSDVFEQTAAGRNKGGSGLGLSVVRLFADLHQGRMVIDSAPGEGTTVALFFPARETSGAPSSSAPNLQPE